ncbi:hypothetical protein GCM10009530_27610 [Microbispora corallina]|uniref:Uncharacterized protein n=1 Tax=Microbispora corallina TaxID=83302 RepID=A0ABQ4FZD5_9ACTN|nr:hypothetical protein Mco01_31460 [Microbispora corallina]
MPNMGSPMSGPLVTRPRLGLSPTSPQQDAGIRIDPAPSLACATGTAPAATSAAAPPLDPPAPRPVSQGLRVTPYLSDSVAKSTAISGTVVTPSTARPAALNLRITPVSCRATTPRRARLPIVNGTPSATGPWSLMRNGTPDSGPSSAWSSARSNTGVASPLRRASAHSRAALAAVSTSAAVTSPARMRSRSPAASYLAYSCVSMASSRSSGVQRRLVGATAHQGQH